MVLTLQYDLLACCKFAGFLCLMIYQEPEDTVHRKQNSPTCMPEFEIIF